MSSITYRGVVRGRSVIFPEGEAVPVEGTEVIVTPIAPLRGTAAAIIAAMASTPPVPAEWVEELMRVIKEAKMPASFENPLGD
jgi:hypothetical protein